MSQITLGGKPFLRCENSTLQHDIVLMNHIRSADLLELELPDGSSGEDYAAEMLSRAAGYEKFNELLGCLLVPAETPNWSLATCRDSARHFDTLTSPDDKLALNGILIELLVSFFQAGRVTLRISPKSSLPPAPSLS